METDDPQVFSRQMWIYDCFLIKRMRACFVECEGENIALLISLNGLIVRVSVCQLRVSFSALPVMGKSESFAPAVSFE